ncbi:MAG: ATP/GTP-binding protein [Sphaerochaetaceae bacterium]
MIVMNLKLNNIYAFNNFEISMSYPKKIVNSNIEEEFLYERPNFRYKKLIVLMGANASGKTTLGKALMAIFNFISKKTPDPLVSCINDNLKNTSFTIEFITDTNSNRLYRVAGTVRPPKTDSYKEEDIDVTVKHVAINRNDSYETCVSKLDALTDKNESYIKALDEVENFGWHFSYPSQENTIRSLKDLHKVGFKDMLEIILSSLDPSVLEVIEAQDIEDSYIIKLSGHDLILKDGKILNGEILSSGTRSGIDIAILLTSIASRQNGFYYCDEKFSYIHSDMEKEILGKMVEKLGYNEQLFFTTHNTDILDMEFPKHTFVFLKKRIINGSCTVQCVYADDYLKRNTDSLRRAVENDLFSIAPKVSRIDRL